MTISQRIFEELKKQKKKQKDLATYIGISTSAVSDWKKKGTNPSAENISVIADFLEVSTDYLLTGKECYADETEKGNNIHTGNVTNSKIVGGHDNSSNSSDSISDDALEIDKIIKSFEPKKRAKFLYQVYELAEKLKDN